MAGFEEVARISAVIEANTAPFEQALQRGEQRGQVFASKTEAVMERAERSVEDFSRSTSAAMGRAGAAQQQAAARTKAAAQQSAQATSAAASRTHADALRMGAAFDGAGRKAANFGRIIGASLGFAGAYGFASAVGGIIRTGMTFDAQMSRVRAVTGSTQAEFDALRGSAIQLGAASVFSATEAAQGMEILGAAGLTTSQVIAAMPGLLDGAAASGEDFASTASILTASLGAFNLSASASTHIMDVLAAAAMASDASIGDIGESLKYAAPVARSFGMSIEQTAAVLTLFAKAGIKGSQGGTSLRASLLQLSDGRGASAKALKAIGIEIEGAGGKLKPFSVIVGELGQKFDAMSQKQRLAAASAIFGQEAAAGMLKVIDDGQRPLEQLTRGFERADGAANRMATTMTDNLAGDVEQLKGAMESAAVAVSDAFRPQLRRRVQAFQVYVNSDDFERDAKAVVGAVVNIGDAMADTAAFVYRHRDAILALSAAYVGLRMASAGAMLLGGVGGARRGVGIAGAAVEAGGAAAAAAPRLLTLSRVAGVAARSLTAIGLGSIAVQALWSLATSGEQAASSADGAAQRIEQLRAQIEQMPVRKVTEVVVQTKHVGDGKRAKRRSGPSDTTSGIGSPVDITPDNADVFRGVQREHEQAIERVTEAIDRQREARERASNAEAKVVRVRAQREQEYQQLVEGGLSKLDAAAHPSIVGLDSQLRSAQSAAADAGAEFERTGRSLASARSDAAAAGGAMEAAYRKLAGVGRGSKPSAVVDLVRQMSDARRVATFSTASVNGAMRRMGYVSVGGQWYESFQQYNRLVRRAAGASPREINKYLRQIGETDTSGQARKKFLADVAAMRAAAQRRIVIRTYLEEHRSEVNAPRRSGTYMPIARAGGGMVTGDGTATSDSIPALLSNGEYVVRAAMVDKYGESFLDALNRGSVPRYAGGGRVQASAALARATRQAAIDDDPILTLRQAEQQYSAALAAVRRIERGGVSRSERDKLAEAKERLDDRAAALVQARRGARDARMQAFDRIDAVRDLQLARAEGTASGDDDRAVRLQALQDERRRQAQLQAALSRGGLSASDRIDKLRQLATSVRATNQLREALEKSGAPSDEQAGIDAGFGGGSGGGGGIGGSDLTIQRTGGGASGVGYVPDPSRHPVFFDAVQLNTLTFDASQGVGVKIMQINGWDEGEDQRVASEDRAGQDGEHAREMLLGGSTIKIVGIISGSSMSDLWARRKALKRSLQPSRDERVLKMPDPTYTGAIATTYAAEMAGYQRKSCRVVEGVTWGERHGRFGHWFEVTLRASDPRRYSDVTSRLTTGAIATGGGIASPISSPLASSSSGAGGVVAFTNPGDYDTPMILRVRANGSQVVNPIIEGGDWQIVFDGLTLGAIDFLEIDPVNRTALLNGDESANRFQYVDYAKTTWGLLSEDANTVRLRGSSISDPSYLEIEYRPASL